MGPIARSTCLKTEDRIMKVVCFYSSGTVGFGGRKLVANCKSICPHGHGMATNSMWTENCYAFSDEKIEEECAITNLT